MSLTLRGSATRDVTTRLFRNAVTFNAPMKYVHEWCTDYREDDSKLIGAKFVRHIIERSKNRVVWIAHSNPDGDDVEVLRYVTLKPPNAWHLDGVGEPENIKGEYRLSSLGKERTRLEMKFRVAYKSKRPVPKKVWEGDNARDWERYKAALEKDYTTGRSAKA